MPRVPKTIRSLGDKSFTWHHITKAGDRELQFLEERFQFAALDLHDCLPPLQRPKFIVRDNYLFLILNLPCFDTTDQRLYSSELDIFITKRSVVTVTTETIPAIENFLELLDTNPAYRKSLFAQPSVFFEQLIDEILDDAFPKLLKLSNDIETLNKTVLDGYSHTTLHEIVRLKNNLITFQKAVQPNKDLFTRLEPLVPAYLCGQSKQCPTYHRLISHTAEMWDNLIMYNQAVDAIQGIHMNLTSLKLNETVKTLTVFSIWLAGASVMATIFSAGGGGTPLIHGPNGFWKIITLFAVPTLAILVWFKGRKLL